MGLDLDLEVELQRHDDQPRTNVRRDLYWTFAQQLAHLTVNGATTRPGDLFASGTVSGPDAGERGSLIELTWRRAEPIASTDGSTGAGSRTATPSRSAAGRGEATAVDFGEVTGTVVPEVPPMPYYRRVGDVPRKRHTVHRDGDGIACVEELMGDEGFAGASSLLYHRALAVRARRVEPVDDGRAAGDDAEPRR